MRAGAALYTLRIQLCFRSTTAPATGSSDGREEYRSARLSTDQFAHAPTASLGTWKDGLDPRQCDNT